MALASHSVNSYGGENMLFTPLWRAQKGMKVYLTDGAKVYTYTIDETFMVSPSDTWVLDETKDSTVTLITCDVSTFKRVIIKGKLDSVKSMDDTDESVLKSFNFSRKNILIKKKDKRRFIGVPCLFVRNYRLVQEFLFPS